MPHSASIPASILRPAAAGRDRQAGATDILWGRPKFLPPELPSPRVIFDPLPFRSQSFHGCRMAPHHPAAA
jgi:hypothetical protein